MALRFSLSNDEPLEFTFTSKYQACQKKHRAQGTCSAMDTVGMSVLPLTCCCDIGMHVVDDVALDIIIDY